MAEVLTLTGLQSMLKAAVSETFPVPCWVKAEVHGIKENMSGHCYIDLVENDAEGKSFKAKAQGIVWASRWRMLGAYFQEVAGRPLAAGMNILIQVRVQYSELYGMNLIIEDIDPAFTLGEVEMRRQATIARLRAEGMFEMNRTLPVPRLVRRFAVISSEGAAGYGDFVRHLEDNGYGFSFFYRLYSAPMQGEAAPGGIIAALENVMADSEGGASFEAVLILRGGGSNADLACYDDYDLAANIAQFPLPVFVAVGHERDVHVCDMVAAVTVKTPTALADYILDSFIAEDNMLASFADRLVSAMRRRIDAEDRALQGLALRLHSSLRTRMSLEERTLQNIVRRLYAASVLKLKNENAKLEMFEMRISKSDPVEILRAGYTFVYKEDRRISTISGLAVGDGVDVQFSDGMAVCRVERLNVNNDKN